MMAVYKKKVMEKKNLSSNIHSMYEENETGVYKKNRDLTPNVKPNLQNKQISADFAAALPLGLGTSSSSFQPWSSLRRNLIWLSLFL